jgi:hypothetical protein
MRFHSILLISLLFAMTVLAQVKYFPTGVLSAASGFDQSLSKWYSKQLTALQEPSLWEASKTRRTQSYRFLWLRTFHNPIAIRIDINADGTSFLTTKITSGAGGYAPGKLVKNETQSLTKERTDWFIAEIEQHDFWKLPSVKLTAGNDGAQGRAFLAWWRADSRRGQSGNVNEARR